jgi:hypothetical protein
MPSLFWASAPIPSDVQKRKQDISNFSSKCIPASPAGRRPRTEPLIPDRPPPMSFAETFRQLRLRRRLPMTMWEPEIPSPYVNDVEKRGLLPGEEKLEKLISVFVEVAREQGAADPEEDARLLWRERQRSFLTERAKLEPELVDVYLTASYVMREVPGNERQAVVDALNRALEDFESRAGSTRDTPADSEPGLESRSRRSRQTAGR